MAPLFARCGPVWEGRSLGLLSSCPAVALARRRARPRAAGLRPFFKFELPAPAPRGPICRWRPGAGAETPASAPDSEFRAESKSQLDWPNRQSGVGSLCQALGPHTGSLLHIHREVYSQRIKKRCVQLGCS
jgi:hypothetical protein